MKGRKLELTYLQKTAWYDKDYMILHFSFELLKRFVEEELKSDSAICWKGREHKKAYNEIMELYNWWDLYLNSEDGSCDYELEDRQLKRLIEIRKFLWT